MEKKFLIRFKESHRFLKSYTTNKRGGVEDITTTVHENEAMHFELNDAMEHASATFKSFKTELVEEGKSFTIYIPTDEELRKMHERRLEHSTPKQLCDEILSRINSSITISEIRKRLGYCFGTTPIIHYTDNEKEVEIEEVFKELKTGYHNKSYINKLAQYRWHGPNKIEIIQLGQRPSRKSMWIHEREVVDFNYKSALEMLKDNKMRFPRAGYKEGFICEKIIYGITNDHVINKDGKTIIRPFEHLSFEIVI